MSAGRRLRLRLSTGWSGETPFNPFEPKQSSTLTSSLPPATHHRGNSLQILCSTRPIRSFSTFQQWHAVTGRKSSASPKDLLQTSMDSSQQAWQITGFVQRANACAVDKQMSFAYANYSNEPQKITVNSSGLSNQRGDKTTTTQKKKAPIYKRLSADLLCANQ